MMHSPPTRSSTSDIPSAVEQSRESALIVRGEKRRRVENDDYKELDTFKQDMKEFIVAMMSKQDTRLENLEKRIFGKIDESSTDLETTLSFMSGQLKDVQTKIDHLESERKDLYSQISSIENRFDAMERNCRKTSIEIRGLPKQQRETKQDLFSLAHSALKALEVDYQQADLKDAFRLPIKRDATKSTLVLEFNNTLTKTNTINAYKKFSKSYKLTSHHLKLTGEESRLFLSEHMTAKDKQLHFMAKDFAKNEGYKFCWVTNGRVYLRQKEGAPHILVKNKDELSNLSNKKCTRSMMDRWQGKVAVVTGASAGIGSAVCLALADAGVIVVGLARRAPLVDKLKSAVKGKGRIVSRQCDVSSADDVAATFRWVEQEYGGLHILVNNAGVLHFGQITDVGDSPLSEANLVSTIDINVKGPIICTKQAVSIMKRHSFDGHIITINSIAGHYIPLVGTFNVYPTTKHAITAFHDSLATELANFNSKIKTTTITTDYTIVTTSITDDCPQLPSTPAVGTESDGHTYIASMLYRYSSTIVDVDVGIMLGPDQESISPGLVATDMGSRVGLPDEPPAPALLPQDIADAVLYALSTPATVNIGELTITPVGSLRI